MIALIATPIILNVVVLNNDVTKNVGDTITESKIALMYVWIPRYEYKIPDYNLGRNDSDIHAIDIKFIDKNKNASKKIIYTKLQFYFDF